MVDTLALLVKDTPEAIKGHAESIVTTLLRMASYEKGTPDSEAAAVSKCAITEERDMLTSPSVESAHSSFEVLDCLPGQPRLDDATPAKAASPQSSGTGGR